jgi:hypothetical protein
MFEKYQEIGNNYPYFYELKNSNNILCFIGAKHSNDPNDPQFEIIKNHFDNFVKKTEGKNRLILIEGGVMPLCENEENSIQQFGEPGFAVYLSSKVNIKVICPEPDESLETAKLLEKFSKDEIAVYYLCNIVSQWQRINSKENLDDYTAKYLGYYFYKSVWQGFDFSLTNLKKLYQKVLGKEFNENDREFIYEFVKPSDTNISGASSDIRDEFILNQIKELWNKNNLFIVYGSGHAIRLESALRKVTTSSLG